MVTMELLIAISSPTTTNTTYPLEGYVDRGIVRHLGIVSVHDKDYLTKLHGDTRIKPTAGGRVRNNDVVNRLAEKMNVSPQILLYSFTMELGIGSPLIGTKSIGHMKEDVDALVLHKLKWEKDDLVAMTGVINKGLMQG